MPQLHEEEEVTVEVVAPTKPTLSQKLLALVWRIKMEEKPPLKITEKLPGKYRLSYFQNIQFEIL